MKLPDVAMFGVETPEPGALRVWQTAPTCVPPGAPVLESETEVQRPPNPVRVAEPPVPAIAPIVPVLAACETELLAGGPTVTAAEADSPTKVAVTETPPDAAPIATTEQLPDDRAHSGSERTAVVLLRLNVTSPGAVAGVTVAVQVSVAPSSTVGEHDTLMLSVAKAVTETVEAVVLGALVESPE